MKAHKKTRGNKHSVNLLYALTLGIIHIIFSSCDLSIGGGKEDPPIPHQTVILDIVLNPDTVALGDTVLINCIIEDSMDTSFNYSWKLGDTRTISVNGDFNGSTIKWVAKNYDIEPDSTLFVSGSVKVDNGSKDSLSVSETVRIPIKNTNNESP